MKMKKSKLGALVAGIGIGAAAGLLLAPKSGEETRKDIQKKAKQIGKKVKDIDLNQVKEDLVKEFDKFKNEMKDMDKDKAMKLAKEQGTKLLAKCEDLINMAKEKSAPMIEKTGKDIKKKLSEMLADASEKLSE
jgi:general stress protein